MESNATGYPSNPILARWWRGAGVESVHRGAWCLVDGSGEVLEGAGEWGGAYYVRSSIKALQALPLLETGADTAVGMFPRTARALPLTATGRRAVTHAG